MKNSTQMGTTESSITKLDDDVTLLRRRFGLDDRAFTYLGSPIDPLTMDETADFIETALSERICIKHVVINAAKLVAIQKNGTLLNDVTSSDLINIDGMGVVWGARLAGHTVPERVAGIDLMDRVLEICARGNYRPYILGAKPDVLKRAIENISNKYPGIDFAGYRDGYFTPEQEPEIIKEISGSRADCLFVAISSPAKERILESYKDELNVTFLMGVGGSVDVIAGLTKRAPRWMQATGLEWLYRVIQEPRRMWKRYLTTNTLFAYFVMREIIRSVRRRHAT